MNARSTSDRLQLLYELNRGLTTFSDLNSLLRFATRRVRELFDAAGCAILMLDRVRHEFYFPIASESDAASEARLSTLRFPADRGIAGWVLNHNQAVAVPDVLQDSRFYQGVDAQTLMTTRSMLGAPLRTPAGNIGVIEVVNPAAEYLGAADIEFLEAVAGDIAVACEKAQLYDSLRGEVVTLRSATRLSGAVLTGIGVLLVAGAVIRHVAWALPLAELPTRPGLLAGVVAVLLGGGLYGIGRGWWSRQASTTAPK